MDRALPFDDPKGVGQDLRETHCCQLQDLRTCPIAVKVVHAN
jgi:hypothetical protein